MLINIRDNVLEKRFADENSPDFKPEGRGLASFLDAVPRGWPHREKANFILRESPR